MLRCPNTLSYNQRSSIKSSVFLEATQSWLSLGLSWVIPSVPQLTPIDPLTDYVLKNMRTYSWNGSDILPRSLKQAIKLYTLHVGLWEVIFSQLTEIFSWAGSYFKTVFLVSFKRVYMQGFCLLPTNLLQTDQKVSLSLSK